MHVSVNGLKPNRKKYDSQNRAQWKEILLVLESILFMILLLTKPHTQNLSLFRESEEKQSKR